MNELVTTRKALINRLKQRLPEGSVELIFYKTNTKGLNGKAINELLSSLSKGDKEERQ
jgi:hypothetical protein